MKDSKGPEMTDRGFLILTIGAAILVGWLKIKPQIIGFYVKWRYLCPVPRSWTGLGAPNPT